MVSRTSGDMVVFLGRSGVLPLCVHTLKKILLKSNLFLEIRFVKNNHVYGYKRKQVPKTSSSL